MSDESMYITNSEFDKISDDTCKYKGFYRVDDVLNDKDDWNGGTHPQLTVWVEDDDGDEVSAEFAGEPAGWDGTDPAEYERLERRVCAHLGIDWHNVLWELK